MRLERVALLETVIDHLTGEELGAALESLNAMPEIMDAIFLPGIGKKNRPSGLLQAICSPESEDAARGAIFRHTHVLGLRRQIIERWVLPRSAASIIIDGEELPAKAHELEGERYLRPEADAIKDLAAKRGLGAPGLRFVKKSRIDDD